MTEKISHPDEENVASRAEVISSELLDYQEHIIDNMSDGETVNQPEYRYMKTLSDVATQYAHERSAKDISIDEVLGLYVYQDFVESIHYRDFVRDILREKGYNPIVLDTLVLESERLGLTLTAKSLKTMYARWEGN